MPLSFPRLILTVGLGAQCVHAVHPQPRSRVGQPRRYESAVYRKQRRQSVAVFTIHLATQHAEVVFEIVR